LLNSLKKTSKTSEKTPSKAEIQAQSVTIYDQMWGYVTNHIIPQKIILDQFQKYF
jgi:hypothetical protein